MHLESVLLVVAMEVTAASGKLSFEDSFEQPYEIVISVVGVMKVEQHCIARTTLKWDGSLSSYSGGAIAEKKTKRVKTTDYIILYCIIWYCIIIHINIFYNFISCYHILCDIRLYNDILHCPILFYYVL